MENLTTLSVLNFLSLIVNSCFLSGVSSFPLNSAPFAYFTTFIPNSKTRCMAQDNANNDFNFCKTADTHNCDIDMRLFDRRSVVSLLTTSILSLGVSSPASADEIGRETEALFDITGESMMICTKRGPLGACLKTEYRTEYNDNDKAREYFSKTTELATKRNGSVDESNEGNALIEQLKKRSEDNSEKNDILVKQRTQLNDASANFGPFSKAVLVENENGNGFTLLENPQAMRLKKLGLIEKKKFTRQPTQEELDAALEEPERKGILDRFLGSSYR